MPFALLLTISNVPGKGFLINPIDSPPTISYGARNVEYLRRDPGSCRAIPAKPKEMVNVCWLTMRTMMIVQSMNDNLLSMVFKKKKIVGAENPVLISAAMAEQIFCAGVNYFPSRYDPCIIEKGNNFKEPVDRYRSFTPEGRERFIGRWIDALSDPPITHEIRRASRYLTGPRLISHWDRSWQAVLT
ncbi:hypothetical protein F2Q69_00037516 [Brassica cretica]|uniref:Uncharacterized protein n=1 Tax=Brassica cretica TaxID=69181 RepID=A0A8S9SN18_BRACR|nr:hypothetical protein F2Q69_00037516 [Brassica cretica]